MPNVNRIQENKDRDIESMLMDLDFNAGLIYPMVSVGQSIAEHNTKPIIRPSSLPRVKSVQRPKAKPPGPIQYSSETPIWKIVSFALFFIGLGYGLHKAFA